MIDCVGSLTSLWGSRLNGMPPSRVETMRLVLRLCKTEEAHLLRAAVDMSLDHLRAWMPWAMHEPASLEETKARLANQTKSFADGDDFTYTIFNRAETEVYGGVGLHRRAELDCLELGYWIRGDQIGKGLATEAARALSLVALRVPGITRVQIDCDPRNQRSIRVAEKLGCRLVERRERNKLTPKGEPRDTLVFEIAKR
jgi:RimJ/RimL family protein N-acetyltransferase